MLCELNEKERVRREGGGELDFDVGARPVHDAARLRLASTEVQSYRAGDGQVVHKESGSGRLARSARPTILCRSASLRRHGPKAVRALSAFDLALHGASETVERVEILQRVERLAGLLQHGVAQPGDEAGAAGENLQLVTWNTPPFHCKED